MPFLIEDIIKVVFVLIVIGLVLTSGFALVTVQRRITRGRYFQRLDRARARAEELAGPLYQGGGDMNAALAAFRTFRSDVDRRGLEDTLFSYTKTPAQMALTRQIMQRLGWIQEWSNIVRSRVKKPIGQVARVLAELGDHHTPLSAGQQLRLLVPGNFVARAMAADRLARVPTPEGLLALLVATQDPHLDVKEVSIRNLGRLADPVTMPVLIECLVDVIEGRSPISVRSIKTALVQFPLEEIDGLRPALEHAHRRVRFFGTDIIREITDRRAAGELLSKNDFSPDMYRLFSMRLCQDEWGDVRARAAVVIGHFHDAPSNDILQKLLQDESWFVRLHTCRAAGGKFFLPLAPGVAQRITDSHWLVREAAVRSLQEMGEFGIEHIIRTFLSTEDRYAAEQIAEEIQRSGLLAEVLADVTTEGRRREALLVARRLVTLNKITMLLAYLLSPVVPELKMLLARELAACSAPECVEALRRCSQEDPDARVRAAAVHAYQAALAQASATASVGGS